MAFDLRLTSLTFSGNQAATDVRGSDLIVLLGPNNAGKSRALREIEARLLAGQGGGVIVDLEAERSGELADMLAWLTRATVRVPPEPGVGDHVVGVGANIHLQTAEQIWLHSENLGDLGRLLIRRIDAETRLALASAVQSVDAVRGQPTEPLQRLLTDHEAERRLSAAVERAFHSGLIVNRTGGASLHLHLGSPTADARVDNPEYLQQLEHMPMVEEQGDGMRAFIGLLLVLLATPFPLVLIDEPEAFLHPPQARELGRQLAALGDQQKVIATHDLDVLLGLLDGPASLTVIRLDRDGASNKAAVLEQEDISELWRDPTLRYSGLLEGLFHRGAIVCEGEADALLYNAALDAARVQATQPSSDLLFTHCGGKGRLPAAIAALRKVDVPVAAIGDLDVLRDRTLLQRIVEALGGDFAQFEDDWRELAAAVDAMPVPAPTVRDVLEQIEQALGDDPTARLSEQQTRRIRTITASTDGWRGARKSGGVSALPRGHSSEVARRLVARLAELRLYVVAVGDLEGWAPELGGHGPGFAQRALDAEVHRDNVELQRFVESVAAALGESVEARHNGPTLSATASDDTR